MAQDTLDRWLRSVGAPAGSALVRRADRPDVVLRSGVDGPRFRIGSLTKTFTSAVVLLLAAEEQLDLDDRVGRWVPELPHAEVMTLAHLLGHHSGTADLVADAPERYSEVLLEALDRTFTLREALALSSVLPPHARPDEAYRYSNTDHLALGLVIESVTGRSWAEVVAERCATPLGLTATDAGPGPDVDLGPGWFDLATAGTPGPDITRADDVRGLPNQALLSVAGSAGAMTSSLDDLATWVAALHRGGVLPPRWDDRLRASAVDPDPPGVHGWGHFRYHLDVGDTAVVALGHPGNILGSSALALWIEGSGDCVVVHAAIGEAGTDEMLALATALLEEIGP